MGMHGGVGGPILIHICSSAHPYAGLSCLWLTAELAMPCRFCCCQTGNIKQAAAAAAIVVRPQHLNAPVCGEYLTNDFLRTTAAVCVSHTPVSQPPPPPPWPPHLCGVRDVHKAVAPAHVAARLCDDCRVHHLGMWRKQLTQHVAVVGLGQVAHIQLALIRQLLLAVRGCKEKGGEQALSGRQWVMLC